MSILDGLTPAQRDHARVMVQTVHAQGFPKRAAVVVMETALVESGIRIYANVNVPESLTIPHEVVGSDHFSVGILQQQVPYWGSAEDCMDPATCTVKFLFGGSGGSAGLRDFAWQRMATGAAAQAVQVSAFPDRYQAQAITASQLADALWPSNLTADTTTEHRLSEEDDMPTVYTDIDQNKLPVLAHGNQRVPLRSSKSVASLKAKGVPFIPLGDVDYTQVRTGK